MTHPTPTTTTSASPLPRGEGMGVGGRLRPTGGGLALALALLVTPIHAQIVPTGSPAADILLTQAIAEQRVFLTCSVLDARSHASIVQGWQRDIAAAVTILTANNVPPDAIAAFATAAKPKNLLPAPDTPFEDVKQLCDANPDWQTTYALLNWILLEMKLPQALK